MTTERELAAWRDEKRKLQDAEDRAAGRMTAAEREEARRAKLRRLPPPGRRIPFKRGRTADDVVEERLRPRVAAALAAAGVDERRVEQEVLFLMPPEFVRKYREIFEAALKYGGDRSVGSEGRAEGVDSSLGATRRPRDTSGSSLGVGSGSGESIDRSTKNMRAKGGGKKWKNPNWVLKDERALAIKDRLDQRLRVIVEQVTDELIRAERGEVDPPQCKCCGSFLRRAKGRAGEKVGEIYERHGVPTTQKQPKELRKS